MDIPEPEFMQSLQLASSLTFWRRDYFIFNFSTPVYKM